MKLTCRVPTISAIILGPKTGFAGQTKGELPKGINASFCSFVNLLHLAGLDVVASDPKIFEAV